MSTNLKIHLRHWGYKMKFRVIAVVSGSKLIGDFEAETEIEAKDMAAASQEAYVNLCHHCASECDDAQITLFLAEKIKDDN